MSEPSAPSGNGSPLSVLTRKIGPLPGWVWVALAIGGYAVFKMYQSRSGQVANTDASNTDIPSSQPTDVGSTDESLNGGGLGSGTINTGGSGGIVQTTPVGPITNSQWAATAERILIAAGGNAADVNNALASYISQNKAGLTPSQKSIVNAAISQLGPPPEGLLPLLSPPVPAKATPKPAPPKYRSYTTKKGDTFQSISKKFYGSPYAGSGTIRSANPGLSSYTVTQKLPANRVLRIPATVTYKA